MELLKGFHPKPPLVHCRPIDQLWKKRGKKPQRTAVLNPGLRRAALVSAEFAETKLVSAKIVSTK
jgi:hypothetical protein